MFIAFLYGGNMLLGAEVLCYVFFANVIELLGNSDGYKKMFGFVIRC